MARSTFKTLAGLALSQHCHASWAAVAVFAAVAVTVSIAMCTFHTRRHEVEEVKRKAGRLSHVFKKAMNLTRAKKALLGRRKGRTESQEAIYDEGLPAGDDETIWRRKILMGERCRPPNFSGAILYDDKGNRLPHFPVKSRAIA